MPKMLKSSSKYTVPYGRKSLLITKKGSFRNFHSLAEAICHLYVHSSEDLLHSK